jgi:hypothetical protein
MTRRADYGTTMSMRRRLLVRSRITLVGAVAAIAVLAVSAAGFAATGAPPGAARDLAQIYFSNTLTRAEVVTVVGRITHDYRIDEGRLIAIRPNAVDLLERDGTRQTIAIGQQTRLVGVPRLVGPRLVVRATRVVVMRDGDGPAILVSPSGTAIALGKALFGGTLVRAEVLTYVARTPHDIRIDEGRIVLVRPGAITLLERDGTRQAIALSASTVVTLNAQPADQSALKIGLAAITVRVDAGAASEIRLFPAALGLSR